MKILYPGHSYSLQNFESGEHDQRLSFINKEPKTEGSTVLKTVHDGTTNEEVIAVLIDRLEFLNAKFQCAENATAIECLQDALNVLEARTKRRKVAQVEGSNELADGDSIPAGTNDNPEGGEQEPGNADTESSETSENATPSESGVTESVGSGTSSSDSSIAASEPTDAPDGNQADIDKEAGE